MHIVLETERLILRRFTEADVDHLVDLDGDPEVMRFLTGGKPTPRADVAGRLTHFLRQYQQGDTGRWAAIEKSTGEFLGWFALDPGDDRSGSYAASDDAEPDWSLREVELGYRLRRGAWGKGYATEGSRALVRMAFTELKVDRVFAHTMAVNAGSRRVMEKAGLRYVRTFHLTWDDPIDGAEQGEVEYELRRDHLDEAVRRHCARFNEAQRTGDWAPFVAGFAGDARMAFTNVPVGPFVGRAAILAAYRAQPPTDTMTLQAVEPVDADTALARFRWDHDGPGTMLLRYRDGELVDLEITFES
jgi:RimJ/RimL family protein N-acetyltransferase